MAKVYLCDGIRTPIGRYAGGLSAVRTDDLGAVPLRYLANKYQSQINWADIDDVIFGCANQAGEDNRNVARMSVLLSGLPVSVPATTINRLCGSGMDAIIQAARAIKADDCSMMLAGGVESMSRAPLVMPKAEAAFSRKAELYDTTMGWRFVNKSLKKLYGVDSMGQTAENVAQQFSVSRTEQDDFAYQSQLKYQAAQSDGFFDAETVPVSYQDRKKQTITIAVDEHPRHTDMAALAKLAPAFDQNGSVTAGNASGINDGAAALLLANTTMVKRYSLTPRATILGGLCVGLEPRIMGMGPAYAAQKLLEAHGLRFADMDVIELNEAFASQTIASIKHWGLDVKDSRINPNGGAIALGHPLGMSGARLVLTAVRQLEAINGRYAICTMCIGVGQGIAILLEKNK